MALTGIQVVGIEWGFVTLTAFLVAFRLFYDYRVRRRITLSAWFTVGAWIFFCFQACGDTFLMSVGYFEGKVDSTIPAGSEKFGPEHGMATEDQTVNALRVVYFEVVFYYFQPYCAKWSMLAFYYQLFPRTMQKLRIALWATIGLTVVGFLSNVLSKLIICHPASNWALGPEHCSAMGAVISIDVRWSLHVITDVLVYILPLIPLRELKLPLATKIGVACTFAIGLLCIFFACLEQVSILNNWDSAHIWLYSDFEQTWALVVICCPAFKALINTRASGVMASVKSRSRSITGELAYERSRAGSVFANNTLMSGTGTMPTALISDNYSFPKAIRKGGSSESVYGITVVREIDVDMSWGNYSMSSDEKTPDRVHFNDDVPPC